MEIANVSNASSLDAFSEKMEDNFHATIAVIAESKAHYAATTLKRIADLTDRIASPEAGQGS